MFLKARKKAPSRYRQGAGGPGIRRRCGEGRPGDSHDHGRKGYIPVISPIAADNEGNNLNVNADTAAGAVAVAMRAKKFFSITDVEGVRMNPDDPASVISEFPASDFDRLVRRVLSRAA